ncbi:hypothetical protein LCL95_00440 [Bacillus timonensis]|nr:hypothetical protein [Bacillus timonensis]
MYLLFVLVCWIIIGVKFIKRENWKAFYPTILFFISANFLYNFLYYHHTLWAYKAKTTHLLNHTLIEITFSLCIVPITIALYLQFFPNERFSRKIRYILIWAVFYWVIEYVFYKKEMFIYDNGWSPAWTFGFNLMMFTMLRVHFKRPFIALFISVPIIIVLMFFFPVPLDKMK